MLIFPVFGSAIAGVASYLRSDTRTRRLRLLQRVLDMVRKAHAAQSLEALEAASGRCRQSRGRHHPSERARGIRRDGAHVVCFCARSASLRHRRAAHRHSRPCGRGSGRGSAGHRASERLGRARRPGPRSLRLKFLPPIPAGGCRGCRPMPALALSLHANLAPLCSAQTSIASGPKSPIYGSQSRAPWPLGARL